MKISATMTIPVELDIPEQYLNNTPPEKLDFTSGEAKIVIPMTAERVEKFTPYPRFRVFNIVGTNVIPSDVTVIGNKEEGEASPHSYEFDNSGLNGFVLISK